MGGIGDAYDNAMCESFFATLECELLDRDRFRTQAAARLALFDFIESWYNRRRRHSALDYLSPIAFETAHGLGDRAGASESTDRRHGHCGIPRGMPKKSRVITIDKVVRPRTGGRSRC
jgi:hypothetical protein